MLGGKNDYYQPKFVGCLESSGSNDWISGGYLNTGQLRTHVNCIGPVTVRTSVVGFCCHRAWGHSSVVIIFSFFGRKIRATHTLQREGYYKISQSVLPFLI